MQADPGPNLSARVPDTFPGVDDAEVTASSVAARGVAAGLGHVAIIVISTVTALLLPRLLGSVDYGHWVLFRTVLLMATMATLLGSRQVMSRFYTPLLRAGSLQDAARLFKAVAALRAAAGLLAALAGFGLLRALAGDAFSIGDGWLLAAAVLLRATAITGLVLLYGANRIRRVAVLHALMAGLAPLLALAAHAAAGFRAIPWSVLLGEALVLGAAWLLARRYLHRAPGWPSRRQLSGMIHFAGPVALATLGLTLYVDTVLCLLALTGADSVQIGYFGLATRLNSVILMGLLAVNRAVLPSMSVSAEEGGIERSVGWISLLCRGGVLLLLAAAAAAAFVGRVLVERIWGAAFGAAVPAIALTMFAAVPMWIVATHVNLAILIERPVIHLRAVGWIYAGLALGLVIVPPGGRAAGAALILMAGAASGAGAMVICLRRERYQLPRLARLWAPLLVGAVPAACVEHLPPGPTAWVLLAAWCLAFAAAIVVSRCVDITELHHLVVHTRAALRKAP